MTRFRSSRIFCGLLFAWLGALPTYAAPPASCGAPPPTGLAQFPERVAKSTPDDVYIAYMNPYGSTYTPGQDYYQSGGYVQGAFPNRLTFYWNWPGPAGGGHWFGSSGAGLIAPGCKGVCGYDFLGYGDYLGHPSSPIQPQKLRDISNLTSQVSVNYGGVMPGFSVLYDMFETTIPHGRSIDRAFELEVYLHMSAGAKDFVARAKQLPDYTDSNGVVWHVSEVETHQQPNFPDVFFYRADGSDMYSGNFNLLAMMQYAASLGFGSESGWVNGTSVGIEPSFGCGWVTYSSFSVNMQ